LKLQCGFQPNRVTTEHKCCIREIVDKEMLQSWEELKLFTEFKIDCDSVKMAVLFNHLYSKIDPICHLMALLGAHFIVHVSRVRVNMSFSFVLPRN